MLFGEIGKIDRVAPAKAPTLSLFLSVGGGDLPYWEAHPELNRTVFMTYEAQAQKDGQVFFRLDFVQPAATDTWQLRTLQLHLSLSRPDTTERILELGKKLFHARPTPPPKQAANPALQRTDRGSRLHFVFHV